MLNADGKRLAKRDGAVTLAEIGVAAAFVLIADSLGCRDDVDGSWTASIRAAAAHPWIYIPA